MVSVIVWKELKKIVRCLKEAVRDGRVRKVLVKYDVPVTASETMEELVEELADGFYKLKPYYEEANQN